jgi:RNA polymerase sigma factor (sigma-70 family)
VGFDELYLTHRPIIDGVIGTICHRQRLSSVDAEDFSGIVRLHLIGDDYAVLRRFQGRSSLKTYLVVVITHLYQDWRNKRWGKWRPSAQAKRLGPVAVHLERLIARDRLEFDEALEVLQTNFQVTESRQTLEAMAALFPSRAGRRFVSDEGLADLEAASTGTDAPLLDREAQDAARRAIVALGAALRKRAPQDRLLLKMRFQDDFAVADIARALHLDQKPLYRHLERLLDDLRAELERAGITAAAAAEAFAHGGFDRIAADRGAREMLGDVRPPDNDGRSPVRTGSTP